MIKKTDAATQFMLNADFEKFEWNELYGEKERDVSAFVCVCVSFELKSF